MDVYWLEQSEADVPAADDWLSESEAVQLSSFRFAKRRADWRLGRWTAKCAVAASLKLADTHRPLKKIKISAASTGQPEVTLVESAERVTISISHRNGIAICAVAVGSVKLGCDLEVIEPRSDAFIADYFTAEEGELIAQTSGEKRTLLVSLLWSAKESALKALHVGLRADTRSVGVNPVDSHGHWVAETSARATDSGSAPELSNVSSTYWHRLQVHCADGGDFRGWWQRTGNILRTVVASPSPALPIELRIPSETGIIPLIP